MLQYMYARFYQLMGSVGNGENAEQASIGLMTVTIMINLFSIWFVCLDFGKTIILPPWVFLVIPLGLPCLFYFLLVHKGKTDEIMRKFQGESRKAWVIGRVVVLSYLILSVGGLFASILLNPTFIW
jgi:hypothetical protein